MSQELIAGGAAGGLGKTLVAPLERVKILFQVETRCLQALHFLLCLQNALKVTVSESTG